MKKLLLLKSLLLLCALIVGTSSSWADTATITFSNTDGDDSSTALTTSNFVSSGIASSSAAFGTISCSATAKCYKGKSGYGLKVGASSNAGSFTIAFSTALTNVSQITLNRASYNSSKTTSITVKNGDTTLGSGDTPSNTDLSDMDITNLSIASLSGLTVQTSKYCYIKSITITYSSAGTTAAPTISGNTPFFGTTTATITNAASADGATIYYTMGETPADPTTSSTTYSSPIEITATTTVKAIAKKLTDTNASSVVSKTFTKVTPINVASALTAISALANNGTIENQCVRGIVTEVGSLSSGAITYTISDDVAASNSLQVYKGKNMHNTDFAALSDIKLGDDVVIYGTLKKYNTTPEFDQGSYLLYQVSKDAPTFTLSTSAETLSMGTTETVDVTLTTNTDGAITCESSDDDVATVALKSAGVYTITGHMAGTATITIKSALTANYQPASATVAITVNDTREAAGISFTEDEVEITWGDSFTGQALTNTHSLPVTWSSTNEAVATVNSSGVVSVLKAGSTDIKATFAGNATYKAAVASYTLTVNKAEAGISYSETSFDVELNDDSFVAPTLNNPNALEGITYASNNTTVATVNASTGALSLTTSAEGVVKITATFAGNDNYKSGSANYTITVIDPSRKGSKLNPYTVAEVIEMNPSSTSTPADGQSDIYVIGYIVGEYRTPSAVNTTVLQSDFTTDANIAIADAPTTTALASSVPVNLTKTADKNSFGNNTNKGKTIGYKVLLKGDALKYFGMPGLKNIDEISAVSVPATLNGSGYATFASKYALDFSDDSEFSAWQISSANSSTGVITFSQITGTVAAGTGVLLKGTASSSINIPVATSGSDISSTNKLVGITTATAVAADTYYGLSGNVFKKVGAGTVPAGKALLPASEVGAARELKFVFEDSEATGISDATRLNDNGKMKNDNCFDLQGRKVANPTKGLYIVNGKKVIIK
jgi:hypothetical protein